MYIFMKIFNNICLYLIFFLLGLMACSESVEVDLPPFESDLVMQFYLEDGQAPRCILQESVSFGEPIRSPLIDNALVVLSYGEVADTLRNEEIFDSTTNQFFNYISDRVLRADLNQTYRLYVRDSEGRELRSETAFLPPIPIDSVAYDANEDREASVGILFTDPVETQDFYRLIAYREIGDVPRLSDIQLRDIAFSGQAFSFFTAYDFEIGDSVTTRLYRLTPAHYDFAASVENLDNANENPFAQPGAVRSNIEGGLGIFTSLNYDERKLVILEN